MVGENRVNIFAHKTAHSVPPKSLFRCPLHRLVLCKLQRSETKLYFFLRFLDVAGTHSYYPFCDAQWSRKGSRSDRRTRLFVSNAALQILFTSLYEMIRNYRRRRSGLLIAALSACLCISVLRNLRCSSTKTPRKDYSEIPSTTTIATGSSTDESSIAFRDPLFREGARGNNTSTLQIPTTLIMNYKSLTGLPRLISNNVESLKQMHPTWKHIFDDDASCLEKVFSTTASFNLPQQRLRKWWIEVEGKIRSDLCRLSQLYLDGGVYLDNDLDLRISLSDILRADDRFFSVWAATYRDNISGKVRGGESDGIVFQAIMGAPAKSPVIYAALKLFSNFIRGELSDTHHDVGTQIVGMALKNEWRSNGKKGTAITMADEVLLPADHKSLHGRAKDMYCNAAIVKNDRVIAFSRIMEIGTLNLCDAGLQGRSHISREQSSQERFAAHHDRERLLGYKPGRRRARHDLEQLEQLEQRFAQKRAGQSLDRMLRARAYYMASSRTNAHATRAGGKPTYFLNRD